MNTRVHGKHLVLILKNAEKREMMTQLKNSSLDRKSDATAANLNSSVNENVKLGKKQAQACVFQSYKIYLIYTYIFIKCFIQSENVTLFQCLKNK